MLLLPVLMVVGLMARWTGHGGLAVYAILRMLIQLLLIGYLLLTIFQTSHSWLVLLVLLVMVLISSWITLMHLGRRTWSLYGAALLSIFLVGGSMLILVTQGVLAIEPWYRPQYMIPLAGMIFARAMNSISIGAERLGAELSRNESWENARSAAFYAGMIPMVNSLFAVGLVSLPGMMTGQILSGTSPLIAARYQIMVMAMLFSVSGLAMALFLVLSRSEFVRNSTL